MIVDECKGVLNGVPIRHGREAACWLQITQVVQVVSDLLNVGFVVITEHVFLFDLIFFYFIFLVCFSFSITIPTPPLYHIVHVNFEVSVCCYR